jgi:hypothetical protein
VEAHSVVGRRMTELMSTENCQLCQCERPRKVTKICVEFASCFDATDIPEQYSLPCWDGFFDTKGNR